MSSIADRKAEALATFARAQTAGVGFNNWQGLAEELAALLATQPARKVPAALDKRAWADYELPRSTRTKDLDRTLFTVTFAGESKPMTFSCDSHTAYSSAVRLGSVAERHWAIQCSPS